MQTEEMVTEENQPLLGQAPDSFFGICQAAGEDLGISPFFLRVALLCLLVFSPIGMIAAYAGLGVAVGLSRFLFPKPKAPAAAMQLEPETVKPVVETVAVPSAREPELVAA